MEEELNDIDLIDKYFNGELDVQQLEQFNARYNADKDFKEEVEIYRSIYTGIEQAEHQGLKNKLDTYLDEYLANDELEEPEVEEEDNVRPINRRKINYIITAIAASVCLFITIFWLNKSSNGLKDDTTLASLKTGKSANQVASGHGLPGTGLPPAGGGYSLIGRITLPDSSIRSAIYPQPLKYSFTSGVLTLYGNPLIGLAYWDVFKSPGNQYTLVNNDTTYQITVHPDEQLLQKQASLTTNEGTKTAERIQVQVAPIETVVDHAAPFKVQLVPSRGPDTYHFKNENDKRWLVLSGDFTSGNCQVVSVRSSNKTTVYLVVAPNVYLLDGNAVNPVVLKPLSVLKDQTALLFIKRAAVTKNVLINK
jgi:hypothetical protein